MPQRRRKWSFTATTIDTFSRSSGLWDKTGAARCRSGAKKGRWPERAILSPWRSMPALTPPKVKSNENQTKNSDHDARADGRDCGPRSSGESYRGLEPDRPDHGPNHSRDSVI